MSYSVVPTTNTTGVRRLQTLGAIADPDLVTGMINGGYDASVVNSLFMANATDAQLQYLWDNYPAGSQDFAVAANQLLTNLTGGPGGAASAPGYPQAAIPQIQTDFGMMDLSLRSTWDNISALFSQYGAQLNAIAARNPNDPNAVQMRSQYNNLANQFSTVWSQVFGGSSPVKALGTWEDIAATSGLVILGGIAIGSGVGIPLVVTVGTILAALYVITKWINSQSAQTAVTQTAANTASSLASTYNQQIAAANAACAAGNKALCDQLTAQAAATLKALQGISPAGGGAPINWNAWLQQNVGILIAGLAAVVILPTLVKKL
jgi:hypothetical protein